MKIKRSIISCAVLILLGGAVESSYAACTVSSLAVSCDDVSSTSFPTPSGTGVSQSGAPELTLTNTFNGSYSSRILNNYSGDNTAWSSITNNGTVTSTLNSNGQGAFHIQQPTFVNNGTITSAGWATVRYEPYSGVGAVNTFTNTGTISNTGTGGVNYAINIFSGGTPIDTFNNSGTITGTVGLTLTTGTISSFINSGSIGTITEQSGNGLSRIASMTNSGSITSLQYPVTSLSNQAGGTISTYYGSGTYSLNNAGTISTFNTGINSNFNPLSASVNNTGTITNLRLAGPVTWVGSMPATRVYLVANPVGSGWPPSGYEFQGVINLGSSNITTAPTFSIRVDGLEGLSTSGTTRVGLLKTTGTISNTVSLSGTQTNVSQCVFGNGPPTCSYYNLSYTSDIRSASGINYLDLLYTATAASSGNNNAPSQQQPSSSLSSRVSGSLARSAALANTAPLAYRNALAILSGTALERAVREITPTGTSASGSSSSGTANTVSGMIFEKAGTFNGDLSGIRAGQARYSDAYSLLGALPSSNMQFEQIATTFAANPVSYQPTRASYASRKFADAEVANYDKFESGRMGGWVQGYYDRGHGDTIGASTGFVNKTYGVVGAVEYAVDQNHLAGVYVAQSKTKSEMYDAAGNVDGNQTMFGLYGQKIEDSFKFSGSVAYGISRYDSTRNITTVSSPSATAKYDGNTYLASLGVSRMFKSGENTIEPFALVSYSLTQTDAYSESGATGYNLNVGKSESQIGSLTVGSIFMFPYRWEGKKVEFKVKPAIRFTDEFKKADTATSFVGSSTTTIYDARRVDSKAGMIAAEMNLLQDKDTLIKFGIDYQEGRDYAAYKLFGQYEWKF